MPTPRARDGVFDSLGVAGTVFVLSGAATAALGPKLGIGAVVGAVVALFCLINPAFGLSLSLLANSSLQVLGSAHIVGLPMSLSRIFTAIVLGVWLLHLIVCRWRVTYSPILAAAVAFGTVMVLWDIFFRNPGVGLFEGSVRYVQIFLLTLLIANIAGQRRSAMDVSLIGFTVAMALCGVIGLAEHFLPSLAIASDDPRLAEGTIGGVMDEESMAGVTIKRITGGIGDANWLAYSLACSLCIVAYYYHRASSLVLLALVLAAGALQGIALVLSYTRTGFLGLGVAGFYLLLRGLVPARVVVVGALAAGLIAMFYLPPGFLDRMFSAQYLQEGSTPLRELFKSSALQIWLSSPLIGHGYGGFGDRFYEGILVFDPDPGSLAGWREELISNVEEGIELTKNIGAHNLQLELLVEYGMIGATVYFSVFYFAFREMTVVERTGTADDRRLAICLKAAFIAFLVCGLLGHAKFLKVPWMLLGFAAALRRLSAIGDSPEPTLIDTVRRA